MNNALIEQLVAQRITEWEYFDETRFALENVNFVVPDDGLWFETFVQTGVNLMVGMANKPMTRELGAVVVQIYYPKNEMTGEVKMLADSLGNHLGYHSNGKLHLLTASAINQGASNKGFLYSVRVPYRYN